MRSLTRFLQAPSTVLLAMGRPAARCQVFCSEGGIRIEFHSIMIRPQEISGFLAGTSSQAIAKPGPGTLLEAGKWNGHPSGVTSSAYPFTWGAEQTPWCVLDRHDTAPFRTGWALPIPHKNLYAVAWWVRAWGGRGQRAEGGWQWPEAVQPRPQEHEWSASTTFTP